MKVIPCSWTKDSKGAGTTSGESGARNLEAESIRSRTECTRGCVKLKTVTEIRRSSARDTFIFVGLGMDCIIPAFSFREPRRSSGLRLISGKRETQILRNGAGYGLAVHLRRIHLNRLRSMDSRNQHRHSGNREPSAFWQSGSGDSSVVKPVLNWANICSRT